jgi:hypothetical protein
MKGTPQSFLRNTAPHSDKEKAGNPKVPGKSNREASRLGDVGSVQYEGGPVFRVLRPETRAARVGNSCPAGSGLGTNRFRN